MKLIRRKQARREEMIEIIPGLSKNSRTINLLCLQVKEKEGRAIVAKTLFAEGLNC